MNIINLISISLCIIFQFQLQSTDSSSVGTRIISWFYNEDLSKAAHKGDYDRTKKLLERGVSPNTIYEGETPLNQALCFVHYNVVKLLLDYHADPNVSSPKSLDLPLHKAISHDLAKNDFKTVALLLSAGANPESLSLTNSSCIYNPTPIDRAIVARNASLLQLILLYNAELNPETTQKWINECKDVKIKKILKDHLYLQSIVKKPTQSFFVEIIRKGKLGLVKKSIKNGVSLRPLHLGIARTMHSMVQTAPKVYILPQSNIHIILNAEEKLHASAYREIGRVCVQYLRFTHGIGNKTHPPISKTGIKSMYPNLPDDIVKEIVWHIVN
jgi:hypothetical protein